MKILILFLLLIFPSLVFAAVEKAVFVEDDGSITEIDEQRIKNDLNEILNGMMQRRAEQQQPRPRLKDYENDPQWVPWPAEPEVPEVKPVEFDSQGSVQ